MDGDQQQYYIQCARERFRYTSTRPTCGVRADIIPDAALATNALRDIVDEGSGPTKSDLSITLPTAKYRIRSAQKSWSSCCGQITSSLSCQQKPRVCGTKREGSRSIGISYCFFPTNSSAARQAPIAPRAPTSKNGLPACSHIPSAVPI